MVIFHFTKSIFDCRGILFDCRGILFRPKASKIVTEGKGGCENWKETSIKNSSGTFYLFPKKIALRVRVAQSAQAWYIFWDMKDRKKY